VPDLVGLLGGDGGVASGAGGHEVLGSVVVVGSGVVDLGGLVLAAGELELAAVAVALEDVEAEAGPPGG
jgi:hypothetical protein